MLPSHQMLGMLRLCLLDHASHVGLGHYYYVIITIIIVIIICYFQARWMLVRRGSGH